MSQQFGCKRATILRARGRVAASSWVTLIALHMLTWQVHAAQPTAAANGTPAKSQSNAPEKADHVHVKMALIVAPSQPRPAGDVLGVYAAELLACERGSSPGAMLSRGLLGALERVSDLLVSPAWREPPRPV